MAKQVRSGRAPVVASAIRHFNARGYHGTSMRDIAAGADVTVASIYHHFSSKQDVLVHIMAGTLNDLLDVTTEAASMPSRPTAQLSAVVDAWVAFHTTRQPEALIGASELRSLEGEGRTEVIGLRDRQEALFRDIIEEGVASGEFLTRFPVEAARAVLNMGAMISSWYRLDGPLTPEEMCERYEDFALGTVRATAGPG